MTTLELFIYNATYNAHKRYGFRWALNMHLRVFWNYVEGDMA
jgi:cytochrome b561